MLLSISRYGEPVLRQRGKTVTDFDASLAKLSRDMLETMAANEGIGLAAQQIGKPVRLFVASLQSRTPEAEPILLDGKPVPAALAMPLVVVNPEAEVLPGKAHTSEEGCLSFPEVRGKVSRAWNVRLRYQDLQGRPHVLETAGLLARVIQHEFDHVQGVLFIDRMDPAYVEEIQPLLKELKRQTKMILKQGKASAAAM